MANTRMTAPNTFTKGLVMDFNPTVTKSDSLVNALNATFLTFNGNEMQLQQDMGNGRVETARLPEGYVPIGTCEFGDIIYIVSYNPLENKSQIGCFPSPERHLTSEEVTQMQQSLSSSDFQELNGSAPTGVVKAMSVKRVVYGSKNLNPGDKYILYEEGAADTGALKANGATLSDYGNTSHTHNEWPKLLKLKIVSIEDSGRIVDLQASVKWYDDYYLTNLKKQPGGTKPDLDSYRNLLSSAYSVFQSKVSGKLAILAELEAIDGFSCTYDVYSEPSADKMSTKYKVYFYTSWNTHHNDINPVGFVFTDSFWPKDADGGFLYEPVLNPDGKSVGYRKAIAPLALPVQSASTVGPDGVVSAYSFTEVKKYTRTYELETPSDTFDKYTSLDSYNAKISEVIDWGKEGTQYTAIKNQADYSNLRPVTRVTRIMDNASGEPDFTGGKYRYVYNLDYYSKNPDGTLTYKTKGLDGRNLEVLPITLNDDVVNNHFHKDVPSLVTDTFMLPNKTEVTVNGGKVKVDNDLAHVVWNYKVAPVMPYGVLDHLEMSGNIDFSKLGSGQVNLTTWRYFNSGNISTLTWGLEAYTEPNKGIAEVCMDFYDNQGCAASYHVSGKTSYAGTFTEQIILGQQNSSYRLNAINAEGDSYIHAGIEDPNGTVYLTPANKAVGDKAGNIGPYKNDAGTLYPNLLYLVRVTVKYCPKDVLGNFNTGNKTSYKTFYRWMWTNGMFNEFYYNTVDFDILKPRLGFDFSATFNTKGKGRVQPLEVRQDIYMGSLGLDYSSDKDKLYKTLGANVYSINQNCVDDDNGNILMTLNPGLSEGYGIFNLNESKLDIVDTVKVMMGKSSITKSVDAPDKEHSGDRFNTILDDTIQPVIATKLHSHHDITGFDRSGYAVYNYGSNNRVVSDSVLQLMQHTDSVVRPNLTGYDYIEGKEAIAGSKETELYSSTSAYENYLDSFSLNLLDSAVEKTGTLTYLNRQGQEQQVNNYQVSRYKLSDVITGGNPDKAIRLVLAGTSYNKIFASEIRENPNAKVLRPVLNNIEDKSTVGSAQMQGLHYYNSQLYFNNTAVWFMGEESGSYTRWGSGVITDSIDAKWLSHGGHYNVDYIPTRKERDDWKPSLFDDLVQEQLRKRVVAPLNAFMILRTTEAGGDIYRISSDKSWDGIKRPFGLPNSGTIIFSDKYQVPPSVVEDWPHNGTYIHCVLVYDKVLDKVVPIADYFVAEALGLEQKKRTQSNNVVAYTLAGMLGSLYAQLYTVQEDIKNQGASLENIVTLQKHSKFWNKDIVVEADMSGQLSVQDNVRELVTIQKQTLKNYLSCLKVNAGTAYNTPLIPENNVSIVLSSTRRTFSFQYEVPYELGNLPILYAKSKDAVHKIELSTLKNGQKQVVSYIGDVQPSTLYTWQDNALLPLGPGSKLVYAKEFITKTEGSVKKLYMVPGDIKMSSLSFRDLAKVLVYDRGVLTWNNLSQFSTWNTRYTIIWEGHAGGNPGLRELPLISIFNEYNPK